MIPPKTNTLYETYYNQKLSFEMEPDHFKFSLDDRKVTRASYSDIRSLTIDRMANLVVLQIKGLEAPIKFPMGTEAFLSFLDELTGRLGQANARSIETDQSAFGVSALFYGIMALLLSAPVILLASLAADFQAFSQLETPVFLASIFIPLLFIGYGVSIPIRALPGRERLRVNGLILRRTIPYSRIRSIGFELKDQGKRGHLLMVVVKKKNGKTIQIKWLKELIDFYTVLKYRLNRYQDQEDE